MPGCQQCTAALLQHFIQVLEAVETEDPIQLRPTPTQVVIGVQILTGQVLKEGEGDLFRIHLWGSTSGKNLSEVPHYQIPSCFFILE